MNHQAIGSAKPGPPELIASGLGWPEGPTVMPDHSLVFVDSYRSQLTILGGDRKPRRFADTAGGPNSCALGSDGALYVCQNGGTTGPWRAAEMVDPSIQRLVEGGKAETLVTHIGGIKLNGPNDLAFAPDGSLIFTDPGTYNPQNPDPSYIHRIAPDGATEVVLAFPKPVFPNGVAVEADGSIVWDESYTGRVGRIRPNGEIEDLGRLPGPNPVPDGLAIGADGRLYVTDIVGKGTHVLAPDGKPEGFIPCAVAPTNCAFDGETLWVTDAGVLAVSAEASSEGRIWRLHVPGGGAPIYHGRIAARRA
ncbi:MAG TPA: SMP-30/gluconolactonase/LRE family protein [Roseiarcus sp.]|nr:SMP-30/gluconolactonase/LRE family protein [Roseiarcus sp.]